MVGLVQLWQTSLLQGQLLLKSQTQKMARLLVQQTAYGAAPALQLQNDEQLQWLASALVEDPKVISAAIFSDQGIRLAFAQSLKNEALAPNAEEMEQLLSKYPPYVEPVIQDDKNLGYVEVRLDTKLFFNEIKEAHNLNMEQQQIMLLVAGLIGMLLSRALSFKRADFDRRRTRVKLRKNPKKNKAIKATEGSQEPADNQGAQQNVMITNDTPPDNNASQKPVENQETKDTQTLGKTATNAKVPDEDSNRAIVNPKPKKAEPTAMAKSALVLEQALEAKAEVDLKDESSSSITPQSKTDVKVQALQVNASATEPQTSVPTPNKPKVKSVRHIKTSTTKSVAVKPPAQPLDTDSTD